MAKNLTQINYPYVPILAQFEEVNENTAQQHKLIDVLPYAQYAEMKHEVHVSIENSKRFTDATNAFLEVKRIVHKTFLLETKLLYTRTMQ